MLGINKIKTKIAFSLFFSFLTLTLLTTMLPLTPEWGHGQKIACCYTSCKNGVKSLDNNTSKQIFTLHNLYRRLGIDFD
ncbi:hypothetical protein SAMN05661044_04360 [Olivibacter domesticus]|uniref:Uncharacterized protein n=1 Tax=Olivibacter domesticus TaxID=407022 RepID=A0A1H7W1R1_OLID1|nr:hypothetical protein SAMN05661044_04360 [Olivibacter domesticus]